MVNGQRTVLSKANKESYSLRTTVPSGIVKQFDLEIGDYLDWRIDIKDNELVVILKPTKKDEDEKDDTDR